MVLKLKKGKKNLFIQDEYSLILNGIYLYHFIMLRK